MLTQCVNCGFYFRRTDEFCLNCGIVHPNESLKIKKPRLPEKLLESNLFLLSFSLLATVFGLFLIADGSFENLFYLHSYIWFGALVFGIGLLFALLVIRSRVFGPRLPHVVKHKNNLTSKTKTIDRRLAEFEKRGRKIATVLDRISETDGGALPEVRQKLLTAQAIVASQFERYRLQRKKIELVRLQNGIAPYLFTIPRLSELDTENGLTEIENTRDELRQIRRWLEKRDAGEAGIGAEKAAFLAQLDETEASCRKLREALLSRQAARALQDISPVADALPVPGATARDADVFNLQATLTDFSDSFEELEREYQRLRAEAETESKLLTE